MPMVNKSNPIDDCFAQRMGAPCSPTSFHSGRNFAKRERISSAPTPTKKSKKPSYRMELEQLEDLTLPSVTASYSPSSYTVGEGDGSITVTVVLSGSVRSTSTVDYVTSAATFNSATAGR